VRESLPTVDAKVACYLEDLGGSFVALAACNLASCNFASFFIPGIQNLYLHRTGIL
jgi:hypothetical protein